MRVWIMDGHNMIFAIRGLQTLQESGRRDEARRGLVERLRRFGRGRGEQVLVVFDGNDQEGNPDAIHEPLFDAVYARRGDGEADDRIIHEAGLCVQRGSRVTVVTNDVSTLARSLPRGVDRMGVEDFWRKHILGAHREAGKPSGGDFTEIEREMVALAARAEPEARARAAAVETRKPAPGAKAGDERRRRRREMGRLRQERRLARRRKPGRTI